MAIMQGGLKLEITSERVTRRLDKVIDRRIGKAAEELASEVRKDLSTPSRSAGPSMPGRQPHSFTGELRQSIFHAKMEDKLWLVGSNLVKAIWMIQGGTIRPKRSRFLAVPISKKAKLHSSRGGGPRTLSMRGSKQLEFVNRPGRPTLMVEKVGGRNARWVIHYVLKASVTRSPRPIFRPTLQRMKGRIVQMITEPIS